MNISAHDHTNQSFTTGAANVWGHAWSAQKNVTAAIVLVTGGTYALEVSLAEEDVPATPVKRGPGRPRKIK